MKEIGIKLREERKNRNLTYDDVAKLTKMPIKHIQAIEEGNLDYFQEDLTYVRFYVRSYCKALNIPYENFKDDVLGSIDEYTQTLMIKQEDIKEQIEQNVKQHSETKGPQFAKKDRISIGENTKNRRFDNKKVDYAFLSLIIVGALVVGILLYVGIGSILHKSDDTKPADDKTVETVETPTPEKEQAKEETKKEETKTEESSVTIKKGSKTYLYDVTGVKKDEKLTLKVTFKNAGSFSLWRNSTNVTSGQYEAGKTYTLDTTVEKTGDTFVLDFWNYGGCTIEINGKKQELSASDGLTQSSQSAGTYTVVELVIKGE